MKSDGLVSKGGPASNPRLLSPQTCGLDCAPVLPPTHAIDGTFRVLCVCLTYQKEEAGTTLPANHLLLLALEDLYLK